MPLTRMFRCSLISLSLYCIKSSLTVLDSIARGFCVYNIVLFCTNSHYIWCSLLLYSRICGHATLGKPKRSRQTVDFMLTDENDGKQ